VASLSRLVYAIGAPAPRRLSHMRVANRMTAFSPRGRRRPEGADEGGATGSWWTSPLIRPFRPPSPARGEGMRAPLFGRRSTSRRQGG